MITAKMRKNTRALSPIFAVLILIAIAVIAGIVVYMFASGTIGSLTSGGTAAQEKAAVQGVGAISTAGCTAYASYVAGGNPIVINGAIIKDAAGNSQMATITAGTVSLPVAGTLTSVAMTATLVSGQSYSLTLTSSKGGSFTSSTFTCP
jgi:flagellin-like protein